MAQLPRAVARVRHALREFLTARLGEGCLAEGDLLLAGCSGGADSLALASQLAFVAPRMGMRAGLITVDHRMQEGSGEQAARVIAHGERLGLDPTIRRDVRLDDGAGGSGAGDRKSTCLNSSHVATSYAVFCLKKKRDITVKYAEE